MISPDLMKILVCPMGKSELQVQGDKLVCKRCGPKFAVKDGIPNMLIEESELPEGCASIDDLPCVKQGDAS